MWSWRHYDEVLNSKEPGFLKEHLCQIWWVCNCNDILFSKLSWSEDSTKIARYASQAVQLPTCLPHTMEASLCPFKCWTSSKKAVNTNF